MLRCSVATEILAAHCGFSLNKRAFTKPSGEHAIDAPHERGVVVRGGCEFILNLYLRQAILGDTSRQCLAVADAFNGLDQLLSYFFGIRAQGELKTDVVGNDIVLGSAMDAADGDYCRFQWVNLTESTFAIAKPLV